VQGLVKLLAVVGPKPNFTYSASALQGLKSVAIKAFVFERTNHKSDHAVLF
jgi:hypothetical protein